MSSRAKSKAEARRARVAEMHRAEQSRKRRVQTISVVGSAVLVAAVIGGGWVVWSATENENGQGEEQGAAGAVTGEQTWSDLSQNHVETDVDYPMSPAAGGDHHQVWADCDATVYDAEIDEEQAVHSLEHGAVWVTYNDQASEKDIQTLSDRVSATPYSLMSPYQDQESPITLTAWGRQVGLDSASDPRVEKFLNTYVQGEQTPELGATCSGSTQ